MTKCFRRENKPKVEQSNYLEVFYIKPGIHYPMSIDCDMVRGDFLKKDRLEIVISNKKFVSQFFKIYKNYRPSLKESGKDTRIQIYVHYNKRVDTLCLGEYFYTFINGKKMNDSPELLELVKKQLNY
jgi:hypothetical protein